MRLRHGSSLISLLGFTLLCLLADPNASVRAERTPYTVNETLPRIELADQHGRQGSITADTRTLLFAPDRKAGELLQAGLASTPATRLDATGTVCLADISRMPSLVARFIAIPGMRDLPYRLLLARDEDATRRFPRKAAQVTLIRLDHLHITGIAFLDRAEQVADVLTSDTAEGDDKNQPVAPSSGGPDRNAQKGTPKP